MPDRDQLTAGVHDAIKNFASPQDSVALAAAIACYVDAAVENAVAARFPKPAPAVSIAVAAEKREV
jgi:hypothetical protein